ncbi:multidrug resistance protein MDR [Aspergillus ibericus CBS 121593]|uniref:Multidrug resistance protein MDR n=1 Tax=Aspergillus ibericus CBS 121593 TaxID=1448316 RepID=A0A395HAT6_9EURO|nr:multidrug resistance protein MDR [Aspergillus ibericus CBS 121593]RAL04613.1 multidrug resistance protein MDR [Aspergillus ibericus CBS 121593]
MGDRGLRHVPYRCRLIAGEMVQGCWADHQLNTRHLPATAPLSDSQPLQLPVIPQLPLTFISYLVNHCRGGFDLTLLFEECFLSIAPSALLLLALPFRYKQLWRKRSPKVFQSPVHWAKLIVAQVLGTCQLSLLVIWLLPHAPRTQTSLAAAALSFFSSIALLFLSHLEHLYSIQPSFLLNLSLSLSILFDTVRARSLWLASYTLLAAIYTASIAVKVVWFILESRSKQAHFIDKRTRYGDEEVRGLYSRAFFWWINPLLFLGFKERLSVDELPYLDQALSANVLHQSFSAQWASTLKTGKTALAYCTLLTFKASIINSFLSRLAMIGLNFAQPFLITNLTNYVGEVDPNSNDGYGLIGAFVLVFGLKAVFNCLYEHHTFRLITQIRGALVSMIYDKTLELKFDEYSDLAALTLMSNDIDNIASGIQNMHEFWASPISVAIALFLLQREVAWAAAIPAVLTLAVFYFTHLISKSAPGRQKIWMQAVRERVAFASSYLDTCTTIKMLGLHGRISSMLQQFRVNELNRQSKFRHLMVKMNLLAGTTTSLSPVLTLSLYTGIALHTGRNPLTVAQTMMSLSIISLLSSPLSNLVYSGPRATGALECFQRIQAYLLANSKLDDRVVSHEYVSGDTSTTDAGADGSVSLELQPSVIRSRGRISRFFASETELVQISQADFGWDRNSAATLSNIDLRCPSSSLIMVTGPTGSGKSTLLHAILGEIPCLKGFIHTKVYDIAFCNTKTWIRNRSIRDNICQPFPYNEEWYRTVLRSTALDQDIESLSQKDLTVIGSNGMAISGGQRQRIALARAIYARKQLAVFDDVLSALDAKTSEQVFTRVFGAQGILRQQGTTAILATHDQKVLAFADHVVVLRNGKISEQGPARKLQLWNRLEATSSQPLADEPRGTVSNSQMALGTSSQSDEEMDRKLGDLSIYAYYLRAAGPRQMLLYFIALVIGVFCSQFPNLWVQWWAEANAQTPFGHLARYISVYAVLAALGAALWASCMWLVFCRIVPTSSNRLHDYLVDKVKKAPLHWLTSTDSGVTLNRFSQDMTLIDRSLPADFLKTSNNFAQCVMSAVFISVGAKYMAVLIPLAVFIIYWIQKFYLRTSRQLRHLDLESKSPLYTQFTETLTGLVTIRAFGWQNSFQKEHLELLERSQRPYYVLFVIQRWLLLVLDLFVAGVAVLLVIFAVFIPGIGPIGVSLISLITFNQQLSELINFWTSMETSIGAVTRIRNFEKVPTEDLPGENLVPCADWPLEGRIVFQNACIGYDLALEPVLRQVSLTISGGTKLGVCGRTGSGKSSLLIALLRLVEIQSGDITVDNVSLQSCPRDLIRDRVTVIPQEPVLFRGTVRDNITGFTPVEDDQVRYALGKVQLYEHVMSCGGLDVKVDELPLSAGQRQLICLARAIVMKRKILLLDEVTSRVDDETDLLMQEVIRTEFANCTIIAIAHRVHTLVDYDQVAVIDQGRVVECDTPGVLLGQYGSLFRQMLDQQQLGRAHGSIRDAESGWRGLDLASNQQLAPMYSCPHPRRVENLPYSVDTADKPTCDPGAKQQRGSGGGSGVKLQVALTLTTPSAPVSEPETMNERISPPALFVASDVS